MGRIGDGEAEIGDLQVGGVEEKALGLQVAVNCPAAVHAIERADELLEVGPRHRFRKGTILRECGKKPIARCEV
jgi:hypothetical protein